MDIKTAKYHKNEITEENASILITLNNSDVEMSVPLDPDNTDYQAIQEWSKIEGNTIQDAD